MHLSMSSNFFISFFLFCVATSLPAQLVSPTPAWFVQTTGFVARYQSAVDYQTGLGAGVSIGHFIHHRWLAIAAGLEYTRATQQLQLVASRYETRTNIYRSLLTLRVIQPLKQRAIFWFGGLHGGLSFFQPQPLTINAGIAGKITFHPAGEKKIVAGWEGGLALHLVEGASMLLAVRQNFLRFTSHQLGADDVASRWRDEWNYVAGILYSF